MPNMSMEENSVQKRKIRGQKRIEIVRANSGIQRALWNTKIVDFKGQAERKWQSRGDLFEYRSQKRSGGWICSPHEMWDLTMRVEFTSFQRNPHHLLGFYLHHSKGKVKVLLPRKPPQLPPWCLPVTSQPKMGSPQLLPGLKEKGFSIRRAEVTL